MVQQFHFWVRTQKKLKSGTQRGTYTPVFIVALFIRAKERRNSSGHQQGDKQNMVHIHTKEGCSSFTRK